MAYSRSYDWEGEEKPAAMVYLTHVIRLRLTDAERNPLPRGKCRVAGDPDRVYACDENGVVEIPLQDRNRAGLNLEWEAEDQEGKGGENRFPFSNTFVMDVASARDDDCGRRLAHLGFAGKELSEQVCAYQEHFEMESTGEIADIRDGLMEWHDGGECPEY